MDDPWTRGWPRSPPPLMPPPPSQIPSQNRGDAHPDSNLFMLIGRLVSQVEHMVDDIRWIKEQLTEGSREVQKTHSRLDKVETEIRLSPVAQIKRLLREIGSPREWFAGAVLLVLFVKGIVAPEAIRDAAMQYLGIG